MGFFIDVITNRLFISCMQALIAAQLGKAIVSSVKSKKLDLSMAGTTGGMPSSHTAVVIALTAGAYYEQGISALTVAIGTFATIVIHDALTLRRAVGFQSEALNKLIKKFRIVQQKKLKELLGHNFLEVAIGAILGYVVAFAVYNL